MRTPVNKEVIALHREVAAFAAELASYEHALTRWSLVADRTKDPVERADALFAASRAALRSGASTRRNTFSTGPQAATSPGDVDTLELVAHRVSVCFELGKVAEARSLAHDAADRARALAAAQGGVAALDRSAPSGRMRARWTPPKAALNKRDHEGPEAAAMDWLTAARPALDEEAYLTAIPRNRPEDHAIERIRRVRDDANRQALPSLALHAGVMLVHTLLTYGRLLEAETAAVELTELAARVPDLGAGRQTLSYHVPHWPLPRRLG